MVPAAVLRAGWNAVGRQHDIAWIGSRQRHQIALSGFQRQAGGCVSVGKSALHGGGTGSALLGPTGAMTSLVTPHPSSLGNSFNPQSMAFCDPVTVVVSARFMSVHFELQS